MEVVRRSPTVVLDAAHNPHGARASAAAVTEAFSFSPLIGVVAVMADKDADGLLREFEEVMNSVVITQVASTSRGLPAEELGELARGIFGSERVTVAPRLDDALETAIGLAESEGMAAPGVLVTGSVVAIGEARTLLVSAEKDAENDGGAVDGTSDYPDDDWDADYSDDDDPDPFRSDEFPSGPTRRDEGSR
jgi:dihydrofolate synthase/folylpolyglutamate synthase